jgi:4-aminobutyrate aminotransferase-like enzyme
LQAHALHLGEHFKAGLRVLAERHPVIGDVRGEGLFLGVELVRERDSLTPAAREASRVVNLMKQRGILMSTDGPLDNVLKIKPPLIITESDVDMVLRCLDDVLADIAQLQ